MFITKILGSKDIGFALILKERRMSSGEKIND
jgi:hypothetical protein